MRGGRDLVKTTMDAAGNGSSAPAEPDGEQWAGDDGDDAPRRPGRRVRVAALGLSLLGLGDSTYLTITHFQHQALDCPANSFINCLKVTTSPQSEILHVPVAILGLAFYVATTLINLPPLWKTRDVRVAWLRLAMAVSGIGFVLYLLYAELFLIKAICEYCTGVHLITFALFILVVMTFPSMVQRPPEADWEDGGEWDAAEPDGVDEESGVVTS